VYVASVALAVLVTAAFATLLVAVAGLRRESTQARHAEQVISTANQLETLVLDLETGQRGYAITRDPAFLQPMLSAERVYPGVADRLLRLVDPGERATVVDVRRRIDEYDRVWARRVVALARRDPADARALVLTRGGKRRVDAIRTRFDALLDREAARAASSRHDAERQGTYVVVVGATGLAASLVLIGGFAAFLIVRVVRPIRRVSAATQRIAGGELVHRVPASGADEIGDLGRSFNSMAASLQRTRAESEVQNRDLERLANMLRAVLDSTPDGILLTDLDGNVQLSNRPMRRFVEELGIAGGATAIDALLSIESKVADRERYRATMERLRANPEESSMDEFELIEPHRVFQGFTAPVRDDAGNVTGRVWTLRDVTPERELDRMKDEFVATVSHELRTPLTSMMGFLEMLRDGEAGPLTDEQDRFLAIVHRSSQRLQRLVGDLLFVSRLDASGLQLRIDEMRIDEVVAEAVEANAALARAREIDLRSELQPLRPVPADRERLAQVVANLLSNALKFTPAGGSVTARTFADDGSAVIEIEDTGIGIPEGEQERLFQRFFRSSTATAQAIPGTGLGLVITKAITEAHGGEISVSSAPGRGTCFRISIPYDGAPAS
jgi:signal transduction histidine kinase